MSKEDSESLLYVVEILGIGCREIRIGALGQGLFSSWRGVCAALLLVRLNTGLSSYQDTTKLTKSFPRSFRTKVSRFSRNLIFHFQYGRSRSSPSCYPG